MNKLHQSVCCAKRERSMEDEKLKDVGPSIVKIKESSEIEVTCYAGSLNAVC